MKKRPDPPTPTHHPVQEVNTEAVAHANRPNHTAVQAGEIDPGRQDVSSRNLIWTAFLELSKVNGILKWFVGSFIQHFSMEVLQ